MVKWDDRCTLYKLTLMTIYFIFLVYSLAFAIPTWLQGTNKFFGLWATCLGRDVGNFGACSEFAFGQEAGWMWMDATRGVWIAGMFCYVLGILLSFIENCFIDRDSQDYGVTGLVIMLAGMCGGAGVITVAVSVEVGLDGTLDYLWGYMLACITSGLSIILAIVLLITRNISLLEKAKAKGTTDYLFTHTNAAYARDGESYRYPHVSHPYSLQHHRQQSGLYDGQAGYNPYGHDMGRSIQRQSMAESADLSNGYTKELVNAENYLNHSHMQGNYPKNGTSNKNGYYLNGSRPY